MILEIQSLSKSYPIPGREPLSILKNLNLELKKGESLGILGESGSGKSTLLSLIAGLDQADSGRLKIEGEDLSQMSEDRLDQFRAKRIGIVFQQFHLIPHLTALENISLPLNLRSDPQAQEKSEQLLDQVGLSERCHHLPAHLSGGECQRVVLARALAIEPALLLADEPTGNLDPKTAFTVFSLMLELVSRASTSLVLVTHNHPLANSCDRKVVLNHGSLDESHPATAL
jgi:putative ABC transport system ATP-binding protein